MAVPDPKTRSKAPPADFSRKKLPLIRMDNQLWRIHRRVHGPLFFGKTKKNRFDDPRGDKGAFGTLYAGLDAGCAFIECFGDSAGNVVSRRSLQNRSISKLAILRELNLVDITAEGAAWLGAAGEITAGEHALSQLWSQALYRHPQAPDGLYYRARHDQSRISVAIYSRAETAISVVSTIDLLDLSFASELGTILNLYKFGIV